MSSAPPKRSDSIVITGFGQFPGVPENPSHAVIDALRGTPGLLPASASCRKVEVSYAAVPPALDAILADPPAALVLTGFSRSAKGLRLETRAHDYRSPDHEDAFGYRPDAGAAPRYYMEQVRADLPAISCTVSQAGIACGLSDDAGAYLCNHIYHAALSLIVERDLLTLAVFVHLPAIVGTPLAKESAGAMELKTMARGVALIARELAQAASQGCSGPEKGWLSVQPQPSRVSSPMSSVTTKG